MHNCQQFLRRLVEGEANLQEQVENQRQKYNLAARLDEENANDLTKELDFSEYEENDDGKIDYEGEDEFTFELTGGENDG